MTFVYITLCLTLFFFEEGTSYAFCETPDLDPCLDNNNVELPYEATRHPSIPYSSTTDDTKYCDLYALYHGQWYRSNYNMTDYCVDHRSCGTSDPIYLNGSIPTPADDVVNGTACVRTFESCCKHTLKLRLKNCGQFMTYCFIDIHSACHSRFCFDIDNLEENTSTSISTSSSKTATTTIEAKTPEATTITTTAKTTEAKTKVAAATTTKSESTPQPTATTEPIEGYTEHDLISTTKTAEDKLKDPQKHVICSCDGETYGSLLPVLCTLLAISIASNIVLIVIVKSQRRGFWNISCDTSREKESQPPPYTCKDKEDGMI